MSSDMQRIDIQRINTPRINIPSMQQDVYQFIEEVKDLISSEIWDSLLLNCSKNEIYIFWLLYRRHEVNMTEIAEYIHVPLNTATGIIARMEKSELIIRSRSKEDKRVVTIQLSEKGMLQVQELVNVLTSYAVQIITSFSREEMDIFYKMLDKVMDVLKQEKKKDESQKKVRKITIE